MIEYLEIRAIEPAQEPDLAPLLDAAFGGTAESRLVTALAGDPSVWLPAFSLAAYAGPRLVGYVLLTRVWAGPENTPVLSLAPVAVAPDVQRQGVGTLLTERAIDLAREAGERAIIVLGHAEYYPRFGFEPAEPHGIEAPWDVPAEAWMVLPLVDAALDDMRGTVRYPAAFDDAV